MQLRCAASGERLHKRTLNHGWFTHRTVRLARAFLTLGVVCLKQGEAPPTGENAPTPEQLTAPGGMTPDNYTLPASASNTPFDEVYSCGYGHDPADQDVLLFSYGEYVDSCDEVEYAPFVGRAENLARFHLQLIERPALVAKNALKIIRRDGSASRTRKGRTRRAAHP